MPGVASDARNVAPRDSIVRSITEAPTDESSQPRTTRFSQIEVDLQRDLVRTLVDASDTLIDSFDLDAMLANLIAACERLFEDGEISVALADKSGNLYVAASSSDHKRVFDETQISRGEGPLFDAYVAPENTCCNIEVDELVWPEVARRARAMGYTRLRSVPLRRRNEVVGVLSVAHRSDSPPSPLQESLFCALADTAAIGVLNHRVYAESNELSRQLQTALTTRILIEQSKGAVAARLGVTVDEAFTMIRSYARGTNRKLNEVAQALMDGSLATHELWKTRSARSGRSVAS